MRIKGDPLLSKKINAGLLLTALVLGSLLAGCATAPAPVATRQPPPSEKIQEHIVSRGETLFAIAWRYEIEMAALAAVNGLRPPYLIYPGQRLNLNTSSAPQSTSVGQAVATPVPVPPTISPAQPGAAGASRPAGTRSPTTTSAPAIPSRQASSQPLAPVVPNTFSAGVWRWPVEGAVSKYYDSNKQFKGINIQSVAGRNVVAAAPGAVVYAGSGLRGYGQLIIIKHSDKYLSAYAHNRKILVSEGEAISAGKVIGEVGGDADNPGRLYFEIRENGKPVDPLRLLPGR